MIKKLGPVDLMKALMSYIWAAVKPKGKEETYEDWVSNRFGRYLFNQFFKSYTEKVWGVPTSEIRADWAAQRIKNLSFFRAAWSRLLRQPGRQGHEPHLGVQLPALRPRPDVGADDRRTSRSSAARSC